ncbi:Major facilitator superfamily domain, general substrate transporter [Niveomyces insectorum RCEF 264]|uniref:Major facilitator superfamily domain, general substrate transporter n=1 Tax=Niveomyces insectorum RCEF 264 TaxID=1081102 RepID=A0A167X670_9HYPO|nr:Major facilitator superfamily domain, general substrate transporter [Niveomyces insectorum RCEF 264]
MGVLESVRRQFRPVSDTVVEVAPPNEGTGTAVPAVEDVQNEKNAAQQAESKDVGVETVEAAQAIWGKKGRWLEILGLALVMIVYEIDNSTVYIYNDYSTSSFNALSTLATLSTTSTIVFSVVKPSVAMLSNVLGRGKTYVLTISFYIFAYILMASAKSIGPYAAGVIFYSIGQSGTSLMNDVTISDITLARWGGFGIGVSFFPFLIMPWVTAYIVDSAVNATGMGWRWGIGMLAIIMPFCASFIITTLLYYEGRARSMGLVPRPARTTVYAFCSQIDLGGVCLFSGRLALLLLPMTLAATSPATWRTPYVDVHIALGALLLLLLPAYEAYWARATPSCPCTTLRTAPSVARGFDARVATFIVYVNGVTQCLASILSGLVMVRLRRYKYLSIVGAVIRTVGYGVMLRLRGAENSAAEVFVVQAIQGIGSGIMQTTLLVPAQISVPHAQMAQITALVVSLSSVGGSVGACIAGGIYTNTFKPALRRYLGSRGSAELVDALFNSITGTAPAWGTPERVAVNLAFTDVLRYMTYTALGSSIPGLVMAALLPNHMLPDRNNLVE